MQYIKSQNKTKLINNSFRLLQYLAKRNKTIVETTFKYLRNVFIQRGFLVHIHVMCCVKFSWHIRHLCWCNVLKNVKIGLCSQKPWLFRNMKTNCTSYGRSSLYLENVAIFVDPEYRKPPNVSPGLIFVRKHSFWHGGLIHGGLIYGGGLYTDRILCQ